MNHRINQLRHRIAEWRRNRRREISNATTSFRDFVDDVYDDRHLQFKRLLSKFRFLNEFVTIPSQFVTAWTASREIRQLKLGLPAIGLFVAAVLVTFFGMMKSTDSLIRRYRILSTESRVNGDHRSADLWHEKIEQVGEASAPDAFAKAISAFALGQHQQAVSEIQVLADAHYAPAHLWLGTAAFDGHIEVSKGSEYHLRRASDLMPTNMRATATLASWLRKTNRPESAKEVLDSFVLESGSPIDSLEIAKQYIAVGEVTKGQSIASVVADELCHRLNHSKVLSADEYIALSSAASLIGKYRLALETLSQAKRSHEDDRINTDAEQLVLTLLGYHRNRDDWTAFLEFASLGLEIEPSCQSIQRALAQSTRNKGIRSDARRLLKHLDSLGHLSKTAMSTLADVSLDMRNADDAIEDNKRLLGLDPTNYVAANNLAYIYSSFGPTSYQLALDFADQAVKLHESPSTIETRGQVLAKMRRWTEAVHDLEIALNGLPDYSPIHRTLATCYHELKQPTIARQHLEKAKRIELASGDSRN